MGCLLLSVLFGMPRLALIWLWIARDGYLSGAFGSALWPIIGFFFLPYTTLAFAFSSSSLGAAGEVNALGWVLIFLGLAADLGISGRGAARARRVRSSAD
jgi:hypothetical protein